ncbi:MAG: hypothetical protein QXR65_05550 [Candidatus Bathyarchaeia archaeon]|nr:hypothetical protein [Candidatus Bathyarchaeota archaeon]
MGIQIKPSGIVYWFRFFLAILAGASSYILHLKGVQGISVMMLLYIVSYYVVRYGLRYGEAELKGRNKAVMIGIGTYIFVWAATWILLYTLNPYPLD